MWVLVFYVIAHDVLPIINDNNSSKITLLHATALCGSPYRITEYTVKSLI